MRRDPGAGARSAARRARRARDAGRAPRAGPAARMRPGQRSVEHPGPPPAARRWRRSRILSAKHAGATGPAGLAPHPARRRATGRLPVARAGAASIPREAARGRQTRPRAPSPAGGPADPGGVLPPNPAEPEPGAGREPGSAWTPACAGMTKAGGSSAIPGGPRFRDAPLPGIRHRGAASRAADDRGRLPGRDRPSGLKGAESAVSARRASTRAAGRRAARARWR